MPLTFKTACPGDLPGLPRSPDALWDTLCQAGFDLNTQLLKTRTIVITAKFNHYLIFTFPFALQGVRQF